MSKLNDDFDEQLVRSNINRKWVREYRFAPPRRYRFDFAWPDQKIAVEIQGGTFSGGAHSRGAGQHKDFEKNNLAVMLGWMVIYGDTKMVKSGELLSIVKQIWEIYDDCLE